MHYTIVEKFTLSWTTFKNSLPPVDTPPPESGYPLVGKTSLVMADLLARAFGLEKPVMKFEPVNLEDP